MPKPTPAAAPAIAGKPPAPALADNQTAGYSRTLDLLGLTRKELGKAHPGLKAERQRLLATLCIEKHLTLQAGRQWTPAASWTAARVRAQELWKAARVQEHMEKP